ncbi:helix-turn-helix transcriptional regulator [Pseudomonas sp. ADAK18]|nr:helix-turn-helix transcriptional regulator [Pseudomonas sp. ADAK18]
MVQTEDIRSAFISRLKEAMEDNGIPAWGGGKQLAKIAGVTEKAVSKWLNGESMPGRANMQTLASKLKVRTEWLQYGSIPKAAGPLSNYQASPAFTPDIVPLRPGTEESTDWEKFAFINQYDAKAAAGHGYDNTHVVLRNVLAFKRDWLRAKGVSPKNLDVIYAHGDSMWPTISDHDVLLVDKSKVEPVDGQIFVMGNLDGAIVKRLMKSELGGWIIRSDNPNKIMYGDEGLPDGEIYEHRILGRVIWRGGDL